MNSSAEGSMEQSEEGIKADEKVDAQTMAIELFRFKILYMACAMDPSPESHPDYDTVRACRLVSKDWNDEISRIFHNVGKPLLKVDVSKIRKRKKMGDQDHECILEMLKSPLVRPETLEAESSDLSFPPFQLTLPSAFFYKEIENAFIYTAWPHFEKYMSELDFSLPADSTMSFYWPNMNLENLRKIKFKCTNDKQGEMTRAHPNSRYNPFYHGNYMYLIQQVLHGAKNAESFTIHCYASYFVPALFRLIFPPGLKFMDVPLVKMSKDEMTDCLQYGSSPTSSMKHLILRAPFKAEEREEDNISGVHGSFLLQRYGNSLEKLELDVSGKEGDYLTWPTYRRGCFGGEQNDYLTWSLRREYSYKPLTINFSKPLGKLTSLTLHAGCWEIKMESYKSQLPSLKNLTLTLIRKDSQIENLYRSRSDTVEKLKLSYIMYSMPYEVIRGFADNFRCLKELDIVISAKEPGMHVCFQLFLKLKKLHVFFANYCKSEYGEDLLIYAITGIPIEDRKAVQNEDVTLLDVMQKYEDAPSLRKLRDLEEFKLIVRSSSRMDISLMFKTTFLRLPKLKRVILSKNSLFVDEDQKDLFGRENGSGIRVEWV